MEGDGRDDALCLLHYFLLTERGRYIKSSFLVKGNLFDRILFSKPCNKLFFIFFIDCKGEDIVIGFQGEKDYFIFSFFGKFHYFLVAEGCSQNKLSLGVVEGNILDVWILSQGFFDFKGTVLAVYVDFICSLDPFFFIQEYYFVFNLLCFCHNLILIKEGGDCQKLLLIVEDSVQYKFLFLKIFLDFHGTVGAVYVCLKLKSRVMD